MKERILFGVRCLISLMSLGILLCPPDIIKILIVVLLSFVISIYLAFRRNKTDSWFSPLHKEFAVIEIASAVLLCRLFYEHWINSSKLGTVAEIIGIRSNWILIVTGILLCLSAISLMNRALSFVNNYLHASNPLHSFLFSAVLLSLIEFIQLNYSSIPAFDYTFELSVFKLLISILLLLSLNMFSSLLISPKFALLLVQAVSTLWSIINFYVIDFHGSPFYLSELANFQTAIAVAGGYKISVNMTIILIIVLCVVGIETVRLLLFAGSIKKNIKAYAMLCIASLISVIVTKHYLSNSVTGWSWQDNIRNNGFLLSAVKDLSVRSEIISKPESYDPDNLKYALPSVHPGDSNETDIILILNETFCDLSLFTDVNTDTDIFADFYSIPNAIIGNAVVPAAGGGTNRSEFELLTSKSMNLMPDSAPFLYLNKEIAGRGIASYLNELGYYTTAMHCGKSTNYSRNTYYPAMGFDQINLGEEDFTFGKNGNRLWLDSDNYTDLIKNHENNEVKGSQFIYLLTMQNHGGWEQNEGNQDTVHVMNDYGDITDDINEYLSSVQLSCESFIELTDYYKKSDRPVILCMVGDHAPSFIDKLSLNDEGKKITKEIAERSVPYIIWSNYELDFTHISEFANLTDLIPMVLDYGGIPLSPFYQTLLSLHDVFPVRCRSGNAMDSMGVISKYDSNNEKYSLITDYYNLEYNSLMVNGYKEDLFIVK